MKKMKEMKEIMKQNNKGFSLVELIIVIAIMAILIGVIGSQVIPYMEKARVSKDKTTLDTVYTSFQSAIAENEVSATISANGLAGLTTANSSVASSTKELLGASLDDDTKLNGKFKSKDAGTGNVQFAFNASTGAITVTKGAISIGNQ